ncbi:MAG: creatininase family protein [Zetaproteobacteria bacterium]|nr:MAG: creatininase family protein [Zetaproteobacteria bacterium]
MRKDSREPRVLLGDLTRAEFRALVESNRVRVGIVPVAATEQHLHHLEMSTDCTEIEFVTRQAARRVAPLAVIAPTISVGVSEHHMKHPGSLTSRWEIFTEYVFDHVESLSRAGLTKVVVLNGHGGNVRPLASVLDRFRERLPQTDVRLFSYWELLPDDAPLAVLDTKSAPGHAQEFETSALKYIAPRKVHSELVEHPEAGRATRRKGKVLMDLVVEALADYLRALAAGTDRIVEPVSWVAGEVRRGVEWHPFVRRGTALPNEGQDAASLPTEPYD